MFSKPLRQSTLKFFILFSFVIGIGASFNPIEKAHATVCQDLGTVESTNSGGWDCAASIWDTLTSTGTDNTKVVNFSDFKGGLAAPSTEGYAPGLTQATDARTYIKNIVNFALGFLGLIAIIIVIYGGFMYVLSAGEQEKAEKGKKAVTYAIIGILLIMGSFAIVNTILLAPSGSDQGKTIAGGQSTTLRGASGNARFNILATRMQAVVQRLIDVTDFHYAVMAQIDNMAITLDLTNPNSLYRDIITNCGGQVTAANNCDDWNQGIGEKISSYRTAVYNKIAVLNNLINYSLANETMQAGLRAIKNSLQANIDLGYNEAFAEARSNGCYGSGGCDDDEAKRIFTKFKEKFIADGTFTYFNQLKTSDQGNFVFNSYEKDIGEIREDINSIWNQIKGIAKANIGVDNFAQLIPTTVAKQAISAAIATGDANTPLVDTAKYIGIDEKSGILADAVGAAKTEFILFGDPRSKVIGKTRDSLIVMKDIILMLQTIQFVDAKITADTAQGNAPLVVNFSGIGSADPSGLAVQSEKITWDLNGNDAFGEAKLEEGSGYLNCSETAGATTSCIFTKAGTYRVRVKINPAEGNNPATGTKYIDEIAPGIAYIDILVNPPATKINLRYYPSPQVEVWILAYCEDAGKPVGECTKKDAGFIIRSRSTVPVTLAEAQSGITFDATPTRTSANQFLASDSSGAAKVRWDFGAGNPEANGTEIATPASLTKKSIKFPKVGSYPVTLEVSDKNGVTDRKIFTVIVSGVAPRININGVSSGSTKVKVEEEVTIDGSNSTADGGQPIVFNWNIAKKPPPKNPPVSDSKGIKSEDFDCTKNASRDVLKCVFHTPGKYVASLKINDEETEESIEITATSTKPIAGFSINKKSESNPSTYILDASKLSFDPDDKNTQNSNNELFYSWEIGGNPEDCVYLIDAPNPPTPKEEPCADPKTATAEAKTITIKFKKKGTYTVSLQVNSSNEPANFSLANEQTIVVDSALDINWGTLTEGTFKDMHPVAMLKVDKAGSDPNATATNSQAVAPITFSFFTKSSDVTSYELDFGDGVKELKELTTGATQTTTHSYVKAQRYSAKLCVFDAEDIENCITRKISIGNSDEPIAVVSVIKNNDEVFPDKDNTIVINRKDLLSFDAGRSQNTDGTGRRLRYQWTFGDGQTSTQKLASHKFTDLTTGMTPDYLTVKLVATNEDNVQKSGEDTINIRVIGLKPTLSTLTAVPNQKNLITPVAVNVVAIGAEDTDGFIVQYRWWYEEVTNGVSDGEQRGVQITQGPATSLIIGTSGQEGELHTYNFHVEMTDNENNKTTVSDVADTNAPTDALKIMLPTVEVTNGPNKAPLARFSVDRTSVLAEEPVNFTSSSTDQDADGFIKEYWWDFGDRIFRNTDENGKPYGANVSYIFKKGNQEGYNVRLKVLDNNSTQAVSPAIKIFVDSPANPPEAKFISKQEINSFKVQFTNNSTADTQSGNNTITNFYWDFNTSVDADGNGKADDDQENANEKNPVIDYKEPGVYRARLTVIDNNNQRASVANFVNVKALSALVGGSSGPQANINAKSTYASLFHDINSMNPWLLLATTSGFVLLWAIERKKTSK